MDGYFRLVPDLDYCPRCGDAIEFLCVVCLKPEGECRCGPAPDVLWGAGTGVVEVPPATDADGQFFPVCRCTFTEFARAACSSAGR